MTQPSTDAPDAAAGTAHAPRVSVVMPVYDAERYLARAIESVLSQSYTRLELVIVDDGSSDASVEIARRYAARDSRVRVFENQHNLGIVATRNRAFREADEASEYFALMDSDDECLPERIARQVEFLDRSHEHALVGGHTSIIDERGEVIGERRYPCAHEAIVRVIARYNPIAQPTVLLRRSVLERVGPYSPRFPRCQDYELWLRIAAAGYKLANLDEPTLRYRLSASQGKTRQLRESLRFTIAAQRPFLLQRPFFSVYNLLYFGAEHALLLLPDPWILALFKRLTYSRTRDTSEPGRDFG